MAADITYQDFVDFFEAKKLGEYKCVFCGSVHFQPAMSMVQGQVGELAMNLIPPPGIIVPGHHPFLGLICTNCGRTDLFHASTIRAWKSAKSGGQF